MVVDEPVRVVKLDDVARLDQVKVLRSDGGDAVDVVAGIAQEILFGPDAGSGGIGAGVGFAGDGDRSLAGGAVGTAGGRLKFGSHASVFAG